MTKRTPAQQTGTPESDLNRPYHHGNLRGAIIEAALNALSRKQPSELSLRDLARTVGVRHSALYVHFRDRDQLLAVIAAEGFRALSTAMNAALGHEGGDKLTALAAAYLGFARSNPSHYRAMFRPENILPENIGQVEGVSDECFQTLVRILAERDGVSDAEAMERAIGIWSTVHGLALLGDNSGPLHQKIAPDQEVALAETFVRVLAVADWPKR